MKKNWGRGLFDFHYKRENRICAREKCSKSFMVQKGDPKIYCSKSCAAKVNNVKRGKWPEDVKLKISNALKGRKNPNFGTRVPRKETVCGNPNCGKIFLSERWMRRKFCSVQCAISITGGRPTSPKASRGKAGIRKDISKTIYFYSRWEANMARLFNFFRIKWIHEPKSFDIGSQRYTPDFYLPDFYAYIEVKNFMWKYSKIRDQKFRKVYPNINLVLLLKKDYLDLEKTFSHLIKNWEYKNSPFSVV